MSWWLKCISCGQPCFFNFLERKDETLSLCSLFWQCHCFWVTSSSHFQSQDLSFPESPLYLNPLYSCCFIFQAFVPIIRLLPVLCLMSRSMFFSVSWMHSIFLLPRCLFWYNLFVPIVLTFQCRPADSCSRVYC